MKKINTNSHQKCTTFTNVPTIKEKKIFNDFNAWLFGKGYRIFSFSFEKILLIRKTLGSLHYPDYYPLEIRQVFVFVSDIIGFSTK